MDAGTRQVLPHGQSRSHVECRTGLGIGPNAKRGEYGRVINVPDVATVRAKTGLSQARFAQLLGRSVRTLQDWKQGAWAPSGAARALLLVAAGNPQALLDVA